MSEKCETNNKKTPINIAKVGLPILIALVSVAIAWGVFKTTLADQGETIGVHTTQIKVQGDKITVVEKAIIKQDGKNDLILEKLETLKEDTDYLRKQRSSHGR